MEKYTLKIKLLSDTIFSGGESIVSISDIDELYDEYKIPYYKGKSIKGNIRESAGLIVKNQKAFNEKKSDENREIVRTLFGKIFDNTNEKKESYMDDQTQGILKFENASLEDDIKENLKYLVDNDIISKEEVINSLTDIRVLNKDIIFTSNIYSERELTEDELALLVCAVKTTRHLGTLRSRGKGNVECTLIPEKGSLSKKDIEKLVQKAVG